jgi:metallo-beta-lactamase class B
MVYADSLTPVSADGFLFTRSKEYPRAVEDFEQSYAFLDSTPCDILITPHPDFSSFWQRLARRDSAPDALIDTKACRALAESSRERLKKRLATEGAR